MVMSVSGEGDERAQRIHSIADCQCSPQSSAKDVTFNGGKVRSGNFSILSRIYDIKDAKRNI
jgi:hypothetical protein